MSDLEDHDLFRAHRKALKALSYDVEHGQYMTDSELEAVDFDSVKTSYSNAHGMSEEAASSVDALLHDHGRTVFIEFKNGEVRPRDIKNKVRDSLLIFCDLIEKTISYTRENVDFILVYNIERNPLPNQLTRGIIAERDESRIEISKRLLAMGGDEFLLFGVDVYYKLFFRNAHTYSQEEFQRYLEKQRA